MGQEWECSFFVTVFQIVKFKPVAISKLRSPMYAMILVLFFSLYWLK